jgi:hypothetical protein
MSSVTVRRKEESHRTGFSKNEPFMMIVILMSSNLNGIAFQLFADIIVKIGFDRVAKQISSVLCAEYDMCVYPGM